VGLTAFNFAAAQRCFDDSRLNSDTGRIARYWLSLWRGDQLPLRADFRPKDIADLLRGVALFDVVPDMSVHCRLAGSFIVEGAGQDITGSDWLVLTPPEKRPVRLSRFSEVARGAIGRGLRAAPRSSGELQYSEEIMLPFGDIAGNGARQVLIYVSWRPTLYDPTRTGVSNTGGLSLEFRLTPLCDETRAVA
jgi:hypothetical protein